VTYLWPIAIAFALSPLALACVAAEFLVDGHSTLLMGF
jgi:hypothetical protein